jgi:hypothetical protein
MRRVRAPRPYCTRLTPSRSRRSRATRC